jgi:hypothetical protein
VSLSRDSRTEKKLKALRRAEFRLKQQFQYIDWTEDTLYPEIEALKAGRPVLGLEAGAVFDLQVADAHTDRKVGARGRAGDSSHVAAGRRAKPAAARSRLRHRK